MHEDVLKNRLCGVGGLLSSLLCVVLLSCSLSCSQETVELAEQVSPADYQARQLFVPEQGCIPDAVTAVKVAEAVLWPVYGEEIARQRPFRAELVGDTAWAVLGTFHGSKNKDVVVFGGVAYILIRKQDGSILGMEHGA